ncbi:MAG: UDP-glucose 4-epimerase GalE [Saprospiraceae bacterium]
MKKVLVTGGCGYIGSHTIIDLLNHGFEVISVDSNINSDQSALQGIEEITGTKVKNYTFDLCDLEKTRLLFQENEGIVGIIHFAALKSVGESVDQPLLYFNNNLNSLLNILHCMEEFAVEHLIFSSSCSVYGNAKTLPVTEESPMEVAESPYARTKQMGEHIISDFLTKHQHSNAILLRYFNPAGAHESALLGESPINAASNLVPVITEVAAGRRKELVVFGDDYDTRDGSCVRDYIHIMDLANAHTKSLEYLLRGDNEANGEVYNLAIGEGVTVLEAVHAFEKVTGQKLNYRIGPKRAGDVVSIYANYAKAAEKLAWEPKRNIEDIMRTAWAWEQRRTSAKMETAGEE